MYYCPECQNLLGPKDDQLYCRVCKKKYHLDTSKENSEESGKFILEIM